MIVTNQPFAFGTAMPGAPQLPPPLAGSDFTLALDAVQVDAPMLRQPAPMLRGTVLAGAQLPVAAGAIPDIAALPEAEVAPSDLVSSPGPSLPVPTLRPELAASMLADGRLPPSVRLMAGVSALPMTESDTIQPPAPAPMGTQPSTIAPEPLPAGVEPSPVPGATPVAAKPTPPIGDMPSIVEPGKAKPTPPIGDMPPVSEPGKAKPTPPVGDMPPVSEPGKAKATPPIGDMPPVSEPGKAKPMPPADPCGLPKPVATTDALPAGDSAPIVRHAPPAAPAPVADASAIAEPNAPESPADFAAEATATTAPVASDTGAVAAPIADDQPARTPDQAPAAPIIVPVAPMAAAAPVAQAAPAPRTTAATSAPRVSGPVSRSAPANGPLTAAPIATDTQPTGKTFAEALTRDPASSVTAEQAPANTPDAPLARTATPASAQLATALHTPQAEARPAPAPAAAPAAPVVTAHPGRIGRELGIEIARRVSDGTDSVRVRLHPAELGHVEVQLAFDDTGTLRATVSTETHRAAELLRNDTADLSRALDQAGVRADAQSFRFESRTGGGNGQPHTPQRPDARADATPEPDTAIAEPEWRPTRGTGRVDLIA